MAAGETLKRAWQANREVNLVLIEHLGPAMLKSITPGGGMSVAEHLAHICGTVKHWGMRLDEEKLERLPDLAEKIEEAWVCETDLTRIAEVSSQTLETAWLAASEASPGERGQLPHASAEMYLVHMMVHDAHHRGQILLALKTAGHPLPSEEAMWQPWRNG
jgi:uncharacterized damage-inducible protein DinB